jgi:tripartite-type tricarboxylate transporter receptor subunit TctC
MDTFDRDREVPATIRLSKQMLSGLAAAWLASLPLVSHAQSYPTRPVRIVVAFTAGGTTDILARSLGQQLTERLKQPFVIDNKPGAGGNIGTEIVVRSAPDGYTLIVDSVGPIAVNPTLYKGLSYNPLIDLVPIVQIADVPNVLVVHPSLGVRNFEQFVSYAKANPGKLNYGSTGIGTSSHLSGYMLSKRVGIEATHIPYKGADALNDLLAGRLQFMFATVPSVIQHIQGGKLLPIAISSPKRSRSLPEVPTVIESGLPGFEAGSWFGFFAPKGTPEPIIAQLNRTVNDILAMPSIEKQMVSQGADPVGGTPAEFGQFVQREYEKWKLVVRESGATAE